MRSAGYKLVRAHVLAYEGWEAAPAVSALLRPADAVYIASLGAAEAIDCTTGDLVAAVQALHLGGINAVIDVVSDPASFEQISQVPRPGGRLVSTFYEADPTKMDERGIQAANAILRPNADLLRQVAQAVDAGQLKEPIDRTYSLEQAVEAVEALEHGHVRGKGVLTMREGVPIQQGENFTVSGSTSQSRSGE